MFTVVTWIGTERTVLLVQDFSVANKLHAWAVEKGYQCLIICPFTNLEWLCQAPSPAYAQ